MKKILVSLMLGVGMLYMSGCAALMPISTYNSNRVKENAITEQIVARNNPDQVRALNAGVSPRSVVRIIPTQDLKGAFVAVDLLNPDTWNRFRTFKEAPVSSTFAFLGDASLWTAVIYGAVKVFDSSNSKEQTNVTVNNGDGTTAVNVNSDGNNTTVNTGSSGGTTVLNVNSDNNNTDVDNTPPPVTP